MSEKNNLIETILENIGITHDNVRTDAFNHWFRFISFCKNYSGKNWKKDIRPKLRSWIGVDYRYIDDYLGTCLSWGFIRIDDNENLIFTGILKNISVDSSIIRKKFKEKTENKEPEKEEDKEEKTQVQPKTEKEDFDLGLDDFIKSHHYEKLSELELNEKVSMIKNEKLKANWLKQIKERFESSKGENKN